MLLSPRQIHLDFHTSEHIAGIGAEFNNKAFDDMALINTMSSRFLLCAIIKK